MVYEDQDVWVAQSGRRQRVLHTMVQPLTATQCAERTSFTLDASKAVLRQFARRGLADCLNGLARCSRVYGLTPAGIVVQGRTREANEWSHMAYESPRVDWSLYGWVCFRHRAAVLRGLGEPGTASMIKRRARDQRPTIRISVSNIRGVLRQFLGRGIARVESAPGNRRVYSLTPTGYLLRGLILRAEGALV